MLQTIMSWSVFFKVLILSMVVDFKLAPQLILQPLKAALTASLFFTRLANKDFTQTWLTC